jgi:predicted permease
MQGTLAVTVPFFALVLLGFLAARAHALPESAIPGLNGFVLFFALPCMLFRFGASLPVRQVLDPVVLVVYLVCAVIMVFGMIAVTKSERVHLKDAAFGALTAAFPNSGFMGVPLLAALLGPAAAGPVITTMLVDMLFTSSLCIALAQAHQRGGQSPGATLMRSLRGAVTNPLPWSIALGMLASVTGVKLWGPIDTIVRMLGDAAAPVALFTIGAVLWRATAHVHNRTPVALYLPVALAKLFVHPLLVFAVGWGAMQLGAPLSRFNLTVLVLAAALPAASTVSLLAERYGADNGRVTRIIVTSTALAFFTLSLLAWLVEMPPSR